MALILAVSLLCCMTAAVLSAQGMAGIPDWSGVWTPNFTDQLKQVASNPLPWRPEALAEFQRQLKDARRRKTTPAVRELPTSGHAELHADQSHRDGNSLHAWSRDVARGVRRQPPAAHLHRRQPHPPDPDPTFHGHSIGHWEGDTLVVDTTGVLPQAIIAVDEALGIPNNGDLHVTERIHLLSADVLAVDLEIEAPKVLTAPWKTRRTFLSATREAVRHRREPCIHGQFLEGTDAYGNAIFVPAPTAAGTPLPAAR